MDGFLLLAAVGRRRLFLLPRFLARGGRRGVGVRRSRLAGLGAQKTQQYAQKRVRAHNASPHVATYHYAG